MLNLTIYKDAVAALAIGKLTAFLKIEDVVAIVEIEGWSKLRAPEKREQLLEGLGQSKELREQFVAYYADVAASDADFSEWEITVAESTGDEIDPPASDPAPSDVDKADASNAMEAVEAADADPKDYETPAQMPKTSFVEGAFEQIISDVAGLDAKASNINLAEAVDQMEFEHIRIGALLAHIRDGSLFTTLGYDNIKEFLAAETGLDYRKATYLISNYQSVRDLGIPAEKLKGVTWSALRHIIPILTGQNYTEWLEAARSTTHVVMIEKVAQEKAKQMGTLLPTPNPETGEQDVSIKPVTKAFNVFPDQQVTINAAIEKAKNSGNVESGGAALEIIAAAYTGAPISDTTVGAVLPDLTTEGFKKMFSKMNADGGINSIIPVLEAIGEIWDTVDISVVFPEDDAPAEAAA